LFGLSRLAVWWPHLGIRLERIKPGKPPRDPDYPEQLVGVREVDDQVWLVSFLEYDLGYFDRDEDRVEPGPNPFAPDTV
jgi:hypothetical protein